MAKTNLLTGSEIASFTPDSGELGSAFGVSTGSKIELHQYLQRITDSRGPRVVVHEFPNRDGARVETLGRKPHRTQWDLTFVGPDWRKTLLSLVRAIDASPSGLLVHPVYGQMRVVCHGFDQSVLELAQLTDTVTVALVFTEDAVDSSLQTEQQQGVAAKQQAVSSASTDFATAAAPYLSAASQISSLISASTSYATAAFTADTTATPDPSLGSLLNAVGSAVAIVQAAIAADPVALASSAQSYDAFAASEVLYAACIDMDDEVRLESVGFFTYIVPGDTSIAVLLQQLYRDRALGVLDQVLQINADKVRDPTNIPASTELTLPL